jgi:hypothetical protein
MGAVTDWSGEGHGTSCCGPSRDEPEDGEGLKGGEELGWRLRAEDADRSPSPAAAADEIPGRKREIRPAIREFELRAEDLVDSNARS